MIRPRSEIAGKPHANVLVVSESPFTHSNGFGAVLGMLFDGFPSASVRQLYPDGEYADVVISSEYADRIEKITGLGVGGRLQYLNFKAGLLSAWGERFSERWLMRFLGDWRPDVVYSFFNCESTLRYSAWVARTLDCPLVLHVADDFEQQAGELASCFEEASACVAIGAPMAALYAARYGREFAVVHHGAADAVLEEKRTRDDPAFVVRYVGSIHPPEYADSNFHALNEISRAVETVARENPGIRLELYGGGNLTRRVVERGLLAGSPVYRSEVGAAEAASLMANADLLLLPLTFDPVGARRQSLSFSSKLPDYVASGAPILIFGPGQNATVSYCVEHSLGHVISRNEPARIVELLRTLIGQRAGARSRAVAQREFARRNLSAETMRERFWEIINDSANASRSPAKGRK